MLDWEEAALKRAAEVTELADGEMLYDPLAEEWFNQCGDITDLIEHYEDIPPDEWPEFVFCSKKVPFAIDIDTAIEHAADHCGDCDEYDVMSDVIELNELRAFVDAWNAKQTAHTWHPDYGRKYRVDDILKANIDTEE